MVADVVLPTAIACPVIPGKRRGRTNGNNVKSGLGLIAFAWPVSNVSHFAYHRQKDKT